MAISHPNHQVQGLAWLPQSIRSTIATYADAADLPPQSVVEFAIASFLQLDTDSTQVEALAEPSDRLADLPTHLQNRLHQYAEFYDMPIEFVVELAIAFFIDPDAVTFDDCQVGIRRNQVEQLKLNRDLLQISAA